MSVVTAVDTLWGVRHGGHLNGARTDRFGDETAARNWLASLKFCGNTDAVLLARVAGDPKAAWIPVADVVPGGWDFTDPMNADEVAAELRVDERTVRRWANSGRLASVWSPSLTRYGHYSFSRQQVEHIVAGGEW